MEKAIDVTDLRTPVQAQIEYPNLIERTSVPQPRGAGYEELAGRMEAAESALQILLEIQLAALDDATESDLARAAHLRTFVKISGD